MDTREFLRRVIPPEGNFFTLAYPSGAHGRPDRIRSFPVGPDGFNDASGFAQWTIRKRQLDIWHAVAAYREAKPNDRRGGAALEARRVTSNVQLIKCLIIDQDVKREGDKKSPDTVFSTRRDAAQWLVQFTRSIGLPPPNLGVGSGYGLHWYWLLENALSVSEWKPLAEALRAAMTANGWTSDTSPTVDAARLLRPPGTFNYKNPADPKPVVVLPQQAADYPNDQIVQILQPWIGTGPAAHGAGMAGLGPRPDHASVVTAELNQAAQAGIAHREYSFIEIAKHCAQAALSMAKGGAGEEYPLWRSHALTCVKCNDGREAFHDVSSGDERYTEAETDRFFDQTVKEAEEKELGATRCETYNKLRPGICDKCQYWGQIPSPLRLGAPDSDLPRGYRRVGAGVTQQIERFHGNNGEGEWVRLFLGNVHTAILDRLPTGQHQFTFIFELGIDEPKTISIPSDEPNTPGKVYSLLAKQGMHVAPGQSAMAVGTFLVAWINKIQRDGGVRTGRSLPYGWNMHEGERLGVAIAGKHYLCAGGEEDIPCGDHYIASMYRPAGNYQAWRQAARLFEGKRPDLQIAIALSFAAPLLRLCSDIRGVTFNLFSTGSGIGKTSAFKVGQTVWGHVKMMSSMNDTINAALKILSEPKIFPRYWDEFMLNRAADEEEFDDLLFKISQGRDKARMNANTDLRDTGEWWTFLIISANRSFTDILLKFKQQTDAGLFRLLEIELPKVEQAFSPEAGPVLGKVEANYGWAGRIFLRHLASHHKAIEANLMGTVEQLNVKLQAEQAERFYITAMACVMVGAWLAKQLDLFDFDLKGVYEELKKAFLAARQVRAANTLVTKAGVFNVVQVVGEMFSDFADERLITSQFAPGKKQSIAGMPRGNKLWAQLSVGDKALRVSRPRMLDWLRKNNIPSKTIMDELKRHGAIVDSKHKGTLGAGTQYSALQEYIIEVPLTGAFSGLLVDIPPLFDNDDNDEN